MPTDMDVKQHFVLVFKLPKLQIFLIILGMFYKSQVDVLGSHITQKNSEQLNLQILKSPLYASSKKSFYDFLAHQHQ